VNRFPLSCAVAALLAGSLAAQYNQIDIVIPTGAWTVVPAYSVTYASFYLPGGPGLIVQGGVETMIGTSVSPNYFTKASGAFWGNFPGGGVLPTQTDAGTETYTHGVGFGTVTCSLNAYAHSNSHATHQGSGFRGVANASVAVSCPSYSLTASCQARGVLPPAIALLMSAPESATATVGGINSWWIAMSSTADVNAAVTGQNAQLDLAALCVVDGGVMLN